MSLSLSVGRRCTCAFAVAAHLWISWCAMLARTASGRVVLTKHSWVSFYHSLHLFMLRKLINPLLLCSDLGMCFDHQILHFRPCSVLQPVSGHYGHVQGREHVGLTQVCTTPSPCHRFRHAEYLQEVSCCLKH